MDLILLQGGGPPPVLAYLDIWLIGGLVLLVVAIVFARWLWRLARRGPRDPADRYDPDAGYQYNDDYYYSQHPEPGRQDRRDDE